MLDRLAAFIAARAAETYPEPLSNGHSSITEQMGAKVAKLIPQGGNILDIGCGQGPALEWFKRNGFDALGVNLCAEDASICRKKGFPVLERDMHDIADLKPHFDCVWARHVLEHSVAPFFALHEFARVLKPGGILYAEVPAPETACCHETNQNHYSVMGAQMWMSLIGRAGFEILEAVGISIQTGAGPDVYLSFICRKN